MFFLNLLLLEAEIIDGFLFSSDRGAQQLDGNAVSLMRFPRLDMY